MPVSVPPPDKRFRRAHVRPARRTLWRSRWPRVAAFTCAAFVLAYIVSVVAGHVLSADRLSIQRITVSGNERISQAEVHALLVDLFGASVLAADIADAREKVQALPWVADAEIRRVFPSGLSVTLVERRAMAIGRSGSSLHLIDDTGMFIDDFGPNYAEFDLPIVDGLGIGGLLQVDEARARLAAHVLRSVASRPDLASRISEIDVRDPRNVVLVLKGDTAQVRVGHEKFLERLQSYVELAPALRERVPEIDYVDLRYDERVYVRPFREQSRNGKG